MQVSESQNATRFRRIVMVHLDAAYALARWLVRDASDAEDVVQDAMLRAYRSFEGCREATARPWLLKIVRNASFDWLSGRGEIVAFAEIDPEDERGEQFTRGAFGEETATPEELLAASEQRRLIDALIGQLPVSLREIVVLRDLEDLSYREIAEIAGIPIGTVMSRLSRGRDLLQKAWMARHG